MHKNTTTKDPGSARVLARVLAEDLRNIQGSGCTCDPPSATPTVTDNRDITNVGGDGD